MVPYSYFSFSFHLSYFILLLNAKYGTLTYFPLKIVSTPREEWGRRRWAPAGAATYPLRRTGAFSVPAVCSPARPGLAASWRGSRGCCNCCSDAVRRQPAGGRRPRHRRVGRRAAATQSNCCPRTTLERVSIFIGRRSSANQRLFGMKRNFVYD